MFMYLFLIIKRSYNTNKKNGSVNDFLSMQTTKQNVETGSNPTPVSKFTAFSILGFM